MLGQVLSHYRILQSLGAGGMGEVYLARDEHLDRDVAVKILSGLAPADATGRERFRREALVLSRLSHPGIATVFDFDTQNGVDFLVMEYVPGGSLQARLKSGPLPIADVLKLAAAIAEALEDAHRHGFLHRDLKPGNVVLTAAGAPKILDFGLARLLDQAASATALTQAGAAVGSLPYMAPEQLRGEPGDLRADVYALGVLMFEMAAGKRPFEGARQEVLMFEIMHGAPASLKALRDDAPPELDRLIIACLQKDAVLRPASASEVGALLRDIQDRVGRGATATRARDTIRAIAVLPLGNVSGDPAQEWFTDGMTEALISDLARIKALRVISRTSAMKYKGAQKALPDIARELNVDAILEGSALLVGNRVRISVQLVSARSDETLWAERYDRNLENVLDLQSEVAGTIAKEIEIQVTPGEAARLAQRQAVNPKAHVEYLKGTHISIGESPQAIELGLRHFTRALELDATFAPAWAGLAGCHLTRASRGMAPAAEASAEALKAALHALELDEMLAEAHTALGAARLQSGDREGGIRSLRRALELNPGLMMAYMYLGRALYCLERHDEAQAAMLRALGSDPLSMIVHTAVGDAYYYARRYEDSLVYYSRAVELDPRFDGAHTDLARSLEALGRFDEAKAEYEAGRRVSGGVAGPSFGLAHLEAARGNAAEARRMLETLKAERPKRVVSAWGIAVLHASLGDVDDAFQWLNVAMEERATGLVFLRVHPRLDPIRDDPRYGTLLRRNGLDQS